MEAVNDHTNIGAIFRSAAALGIDAVLLSPDCADPLYRRTAHFVIETARPSVPTLVNMIMMQLELAGAGPKIS